MRLGTRVTILALVLLVGGCMSTPQSKVLFMSPPSKLEPETLLTHVPFYPQEKYQCGPAALAMALSAAEVQVTPDELFNKVYVPGKQGSYQAELIAASRAYDRLAYVIAPDLEALLSEVSAGNPVLVLQNLGLSFAPQWHYAVVTGYDLAERRLILHSGTIENYRLPLKTFERTWARSGYWGMVVTGPDRLPVTTTAERLFTSLTAMQETGVKDDVLLDYFRTASDNWPGNTNLQMGYGNQLYVMDNMDAALEVFDRVTASQPDYAPAFNNMAWILYQQQRYREALPHAHKATNLGGDFSEQYRNTLALITTALDQSSRR